MLMEQCLMAFRFFNIYSKCDKWERKKDMLDGENNTWTTCLHSHGLFVLDCNEIFARIWSRRCLIRKFITIIMLFEQRIGFTCLNKRVLAKLSARASDEIWVETLTHLNNISNVTFFNGLNCDEQERNRKWYNAAQADRNMWCGWMKPAGGYFQDEYKLCGNLKMVAVVHVCQWKWCSFRYLWWRRI